MGQRRIYQTRWPYFITTNIRDNEWYLTNTSRAKMVSENIFYYTRQLNFKLYSYVIMPDHLHLLVKPNELGKNISKFMQGVKCFTKKNVRDIFEVKGSIWQKSFHYQIIKHKERFINTIRYIQNNPRKKDLEDKYYQLPYYYIDKQQIIAYQ